MADVYAVLFTLVGILVSLPALLVGLNLLLPKSSRRAAIRLRQTPGRSFLLGLPVTFFLMLWIAITGQVNAGLVRATAVVAAVVGMGLATVGAAGMARLLGERTARAGGAEERDGGSSWRDVLRGAVLYELSCLVPIVGWFLFAPLAGITVMGAALFALLGWTPPEAAITPQVVAIKASTSQ